MTAIPCPDFFEEAPGIIPPPIRRTNPDSIKDRHANLVYSMDLSPLPGDEQLGNQYGALSLWDLPVSHAAQTDDDNGDDLIVVSILNRVYRLDRRRFRDEWLHNSFASIYRMLTVGPIPTAADSSDKGGYSPDELKRFLEFQFSNRDLPQAGPLSKWRISVGEWENEDATYNVKTREGGQRVRVRATVKGKAFTVRLEHAANEPFHLESWLAVWQGLGRRIPLSKKAI